MYNIVNLWDNCTHEFMDLVLRFASGSPSTGSLPSALMSWPFRSIFIHSFWFLSIYVNFCQFECWFMLSVELVPWTHRRGTPRHPIPSQPPTRWNKLWCWSSFWRVCPCSERRLESSAGLWTRWMRKPRTSARWRDHHGSYWEFFIQTSYHKYVLNLYFLIYQIDDLRLSLSSDL